MTPLEILGALPNRIAEILRELQEEKGFDGPLSIVIVWAKLNVLIWDYVDEKITFVSEYHPTENRNMILPVNIMVSDENGQAAHFSMEFGLTIQAVTSTPVN